MTPCGAGAPSRCTYSLMAPQHRRNAALHASHQLLSKVPLALPNSAHLQALGGDARCRDRTEPPRGSQEHGFPLATQLSEFRQASRCAHLQALGGGASGLGGGRGARLGVGGAVAERPLGGGPGGGLRIGRSAPRLQLPQQRRCRLRQPLRQLLELCGIRVSQEIRPCRSNEYCGVWAIRP